jgi:hypothetical protein
MHVINARRKGGCHGHASAPHGIGGFSASVFHRPGCYRRRRSPLNQNPQRERADIAQPSTGMGFVFRFSAGDTLEIEDNSPQFSTVQSTRKVAGMTSKSKRNDTLESHADPIQPHPENSANQAPNHDQIRLRAYEIYLEGGSVPGRDLDDWLKAERELRKVALFRQDSKRLSPRDHSDSGARN